MGAPSTGWRTLAAFFGVAFGVAVLFALVALVALQPRDGLAWVQVPDLAADLRVDSGLQTKPLKNSVVAAVLQDERLDGATASGLAVAPALAAAPPPATVALNLPPTARPVTTPDPTAPPAPTPNPRPAATPTPAPTPAPTSSPPPTPSPTPAPTPTPTSVPFAIASASESVTEAPRNPNNSGRCALTTVTATGGFTTNGVGGSVTYQWVRVDSQGTRTIGASGSVPVAAGDRSLHTVASDTFTPAHSGSDQLVFLSPAYSVPAQSWNCVG